MAPTMRERLATLTRKCRHAAQRQTPAMASRLTDHLWSLNELLKYKVAPPLWEEPKRRGRPRTRPLPDPSLPKRPRGCPRKVPFDAHAKANCLSGKRYPSKAPSLPVARRKTAALG